MATMIYKYQIGGARAGLYDPISLPVRAEVLSAAAIKDSVFIWAKVDTDETQHEARTFAVFGTGFDIPKVEGGSFEFIDTALMHGGILVWHIFELRRPR